MGQKHGIKGRHKRCHIVIYVIGTRSKIKKQEYFWFETSTSIFMVKVDSWKKPTKFKLHVDLHLGLELGLIKDAISNQSI